MSTEISSLSSLSSNSEISNEINDKKNHEEIEATVIIATVYESLAKGDVASAGRVMAYEDLEYWFHGPPTCHHMMRALTGGSSTTPSGSFRFEPRSIGAVSSYGSGSGDGTCVVIAEGWEGEKAYWVHVWTVERGIVTQLREYFNTWLTVRDVRTYGSGGGGELWHSMPRDLFRRSLPGLLLAI